MPKIVGLLAAFTALIAGLLAAVDPVACLGNALIAFLVGTMGTQLWNGFFKSPGPRFEIPKTVAERPEATQDN